MNYWIAGEQRPQQPIPDWCDGKECPMLWDHRCVAAGKDLCYMQKCPEMRVIIRERADSK